MPLAAASDLFGTKSDLALVAGEARVAMPPPRPLGTPHLAYLRALVQKIDPQDAAARYLPNQERATLTEQLRMLQFLQGEFSRADRIRNRTIPLAADIPFAPLDNLLRRELEDRALVRNRAPEAQTFEQFADTQPEGFDRAELREIYLNDLATRAHKRRRSAARDWDVQGALRAIDALREFIQTPAAPAHRIAAWFTPGIVKALAAQNVNTIGELLAFMNQHGYRWYRRAPRIGRLRAARIARWLLTDCRLAAGTLTALALTPRTSLTNDTMLAVREGRGPIRPLQHLVLPIALDGMRGEFRARDGRCTIGAHSDVEAIERWLHAQTNNSNTRRAYEREAERLLQWCVLEKAKPLSSMTTDDAIEYREFLVGIADAAAHWPWRTPRSAWIGRRSQPRASPHWRPFVGTLSKTSIERALAIVRSLFAWLNKVGYLDRNAWTGVNTQLGSHRAFKAEVPAQDVQGRALSVAQWRAMDQSLAEIGRDERGLRLRFLVRFAIATGLRRDEIATATTGQIKAVRLRQAADAQTRNESNGATAARYSIYVNGKGGKVREVPLAKSVIAAMGEYLNARGLNADPTLNPQATALVAKLRGEVERPRKPPREEAPLVQTGTAAGQGGLHPERIYAILKWVFRLAARRMKGEGQDDEAARLARATPHWTRHTFGTMAAEANVPMPVLQGLMGHSAPTTTMKYFSRRREAQFEAIDRAFE